MLNRALQSLKRGPVTVFTQIRTSTKRAAGSRTSMKDSAGRRLGPKKYEGQVVKPGEIIMRQRGTKFYPGEHVGIGKDHTIYALEPGFVRYYLDPFHPKRKFIGVALKKDAVLPTPHFAPRARRFGHVLLDNRKAATKEEQSLTRKQYLAKDQIMEELEKRENNRELLKKSYDRFLKEELNLDLPDQELGLEYLVRLRSCLKNGFTPEEAQFYAKRYLEICSRLAGKREGWDADVLQTKIATVEQIAKTLNSSVCFSNKFDLIKYLSPEEKVAAKEQLVKDLEAMSQSLSNKKDLKAIRDRFADACNYLTLSEEVHLRRTFLKPVRSESESVSLPEQQQKKKKKGDNIVFTRFNYEKGSPETIERARADYLAKL